MSAPRVVEVTTSATRLVESSRGGNQTHAKRAIVLSILSTEAAPVFLAYGSKDGLTTLTGEPLYPGQTKTIAPESPVFGGLQDQAIWAISTVSIDVRVQEVF
jgi:hypothetical protein